MHRRTNLAVCSRSGASILGVILINGSFSFAQEYRASRAIEP